MEQGPIIIADGTGIANALVFTLLRKDVDRFNALLGDVLEMHTKGNTIVNYYDGAMNYLMTPLQFSDRLWDLAIESPELIVQVDTLRDIIRGDNGESKGQKLLHSYRQTAFLMISG